MKHITTIINAALGLRAVVSQREDLKYAMQLQDVEGDFVLGVYTTRLFNDRNAAIAAAIVATVEEQD